MESNAKDEDWMNVDIKEIENNLNFLKSEVDNVLPDSVFNLDEVGCHYYVDSEKKNMLSFHKVLKPVQWIILYQDVGKGHLQ